MNVILSLWKALGRLETREQGQNNAFAGGSDMVNGPSII